jgi:hypothetical protein
MCEESQSGARCWNFMMQRAFVAQAIGQEKNERELFPNDKQIVSSALTRGLQIRSDLISTLSSARLLRGLPFCSSELFPFL